MADLTIHETIIISDRRKIEIDNVNEILGFDDGYACLGIDDGKIIVEGEDLKIEELNNNSKKIRLIGDFKALYYAKDKKRRGIKGFLS